MKDKKLIDALDNAIALITVAIDALEDKQTVCCKDGEPKTIKNWSTPNGYFTKRF